MKFFLPLLLAAVSISAQANVTYQWTVVDNRRPYDMQFRMTFTDETVAAGHVEMQMPTGSQVDTSYGLLDLRYQTLNPDVGIWFSPAAYSIGPWSNLDIDLNFLGGGMLSGSLYANNSETDIRMQSMDDLFTVTWANSDRGMVASGCAPFENCAGAKGQFLRTEVADTVASVPEPAGLALSGFGLLALLGARVRFRGKTVLP